MSGTSSARPTAPTAKLRPGQVVDLERDRDVRHHPAEVEDGAGDEQQPEVARLAQRRDVHPHGAEAVAPGHEVTLNGVSHRAGRAREFAHAGSRLSARDPDPGAAARHAGDVADLRAVLADGLDVVRRRAPRAAPPRPPSARTRRRCSGGRRHRRGSRCWSAGCRSRNRSGRNTLGLGVVVRAGVGDQDRRPDGHAGRQVDAADGGRAPCRVRTTIGITGCRRIDSLSTASSQASSPSSAAAVVRASSAGSRPSS